MKRHPLPTKTAAGAHAAKLRRHAETRLRLGRPQAAAKRPATDPRRLLHELQVHQLELEMQAEELRKARDEMEAGLEKYRELYDFAPVCYLTLGRDGAIRETNLAAIRLLGISRIQDPRLHPRFGFFVAPEDRAAFAAFLVQTFARGSREECEVKLLLPDRPPVDVRLRANRLDQGELCQMAMTDITTRKRAEEMLRVSEIRYRRIFETAHDGLLLLDPGTGRITDANPFMTGLLGYPRDQLLGKHLFEIGLLKDAAASQEMFRKLKRTHEVRYEDLPLETQDGRHQEVEVVANLYNENGQTVIQCNIRDITARRRAEDILRRNEALFSALIDQAPVGVFVLDAGFRLMQVNPRALPIFGGIHPLIGQDFTGIHRTLWPRRISDRILACFRRTLRTGETYQSPEIAERRRDTGVKEIYEWQVQRITLPAGEFGVVAFFNNITARKQAEGVQRSLDVLTASNAKLEQEIIRREAVEASLRSSEHRTRLLLEESHQFRRRLRELTHRSIQAQENQRKEISRELHDEISQLLLGINLHLAIFAKSAKLNPQGIRRSIAPVRRLVAKSVRVVHRFAHELRPAILDDLGLIPALHSYIDDFPKRKSRKIRFTAYADVETLDHDKKTVLYRITQEALVNIAKHAGARLVKVTILKARGGVCLEITDDGRGFAVNRLTSPRWSQRLGLIGMRERVEMVGGQFSVESTPGQGTTIRVAIPFAQATQRTSSFAPFPAIGGDPAGARSQTGRKPA